MNSGRRIVVAAIVFVGVLTIVLLLAPSREPVYRGHTLSWWIHQYDEANLASNFDRRDEVERAIQQIGTNTLPTLLHWIRYDPPQWQQVLKLEHGPARVRDAIVAFYVIGNAAHPAVGELEGLLASQSPSVRNNALAAIANMQGQKALILAAGLTNSDSTLRLRAAESIGRFFQARTSGLSGDPDLDPAPAVPLLTNVLSDRDINVRRAATNTLRIIAPQALPPTITVTNSFH